MDLNRFNTVWVLLVFFSVNNSIVIAKETVSSNLGTQTPTELPSAQNKSDLATSLQRTVEQHQAEIEKIELQQGPYGNKLTQELLNLAATLQRTNKHRQAIETYERALHLNRISEGLYSVGQIPILDNLITSLKALKQWESVDEQLSYQYWLHSMNFADDSAKMININLKSAYWALKAYSLQLGRTPNDYLLNSFKLFKHSAELIDKEYGSSNSQIIEPLNGLLLTNYLIAVARVSSDTMTYERGQNQGEVREVVDLSHFNKLKVRSFPNGLKIIKRQLDILNQQKIKNHPRIVQTMLKLADWKLMYGKKQSAVIAYKDAYQYIQTHDANNEYYRQLFSKPVALPSFKILTHNTTEELSEQEILADRKYVKASFNVTQLGKVKNIKVIKTNPENQDRMSSKIVKLLRNSTFRPQLKHGDPILTEQAKLHFFID